MSPPHLSCLRSLSRTCFALRALVIQEPLLFSGILAGSITTGGADRPDRRLHRKPAKCSRQGDRFRGALLQERALDHRRDAR